MMKMNQGLNITRKNFLKLGILFTSIVIVLFYPIASEASYGVELNNSWTFNVVKASRNFQYSLGVLKGDVSSFGYLLGNTKVPVRDHFNMTILSIESSFPENVSFRLNSANSAITAKSSADSFQKGIQESLGVSVLGEGNFLFDQEGLNAGNDIFIAPDNTSWTSLIQLWNISITELTGAIEGLEYVINLDYSNNLIDYIMQIEYEGTLVDSTMGINFDFSYNAFLQWEKRTGVLLKYKFGSYMTGTYNGSFSASFDMNLEIERNDRQKVLENTTQESPGFEFLFIFVTLLLISGTKKFKV
ncbi:MAG: choice-of-anchor S family protein [Candidatus Hodarchaeales archaeon]